MNRLSFVVNKVIQEAIIIFVNAIAFVESSLGLAQALRLKTPGHASFAMTGSFANPGPYGGLIAILLVILGAYVIQNRYAQKWYDKAIVVLSSISCALCIIVLPASMSRAAWFAIGVAALVFGFKELDLAYWIRKHNTVAAIASVIVIIVMIGVFFLKKDSAIGRLHIWHMELLAIAEAPLSGHGKGTVLGVYGDTQAEYFAEKERPKIITKVAGCPEYAFNEYLKIGVEYGIPAMVGVIVVMIALITLLLKYRSPFAYGLIAFSVFAFFSYPLEAIPIKSEAEKKWESIRYLSGMELYEDAVEELAPLYGDLKDNYRYIYDYGYALHKCNRYQESNEILKEGAKISSDPMFYNIIGKNQEAMGLYEEAEKAYLHAHHMVPYRLYPLTLLMKMKIRLQDTDQALIYARKIVSMPVNERHMTMMRLQNDAKECVDSLSNIISD
jgi:tetratricopeptide (TPR) repeat protein